MQNWGGEENEAMRGYIIYAAALMNSASRAEYGSDQISENDLQALLRFLYRATDDLTADEAQAYYHKSNF